MSVNEFKSNKHYQAVANFYGARLAQRSQVPLIQHIDEGLHILHWLQAPLACREAWCLHPLLQEDRCLQESVQPGALLLACRPDPLPLLLAMEYRQVANAYLSCHYQSEQDAIALSCLAEVNLMLIADKVQNRKDFELFHLGSHPKSAILGSYFQNWLRRLQVSEEQYQQMCSALSNISVKA